MTDLKPKEVYILDHAICRECDSRILGKNWSPWNWSHLIASYYCVNQDCPRHKEELCVTDKAEDFFSTHRKQRYH